MQPLSIWKEIQQCDELVLPNSSHFEGEMFGYSKDALECPDLSISVKELKTLAEISGLSSTSGPKSLRFHFKMLATSLKQRLEVASHSTWWTSLLHLVFYSMDGQRKIKTIKTSSCHASDKSRSVLLVSTCFHEEEWNRALRFKCPWFFHYCRQWYSNHTLFFIDS